MLREKISKIEETYNFIYQRFVESNLLIKILDEKSI